MTRTRSSRESSRILGGLGVNVAAPASTTAKRSRWSFRPRPTCRRRIRLPPRSRSGLAARSRGAEGCGPQLCEPQRVGRRSGHELAAHSGGDAPAVRHRARHASAIHRSPARWKRMRPAGRCGRASSGPPAPASSLEGHHGNTAPRRRGLTASRHAERSRSRLSLPDTGAEPALRHVQRHTGRLERSRRYCRVRREPG